MSWSTASISFNNIYYPLENNNEVLGCSCLFIAIKTYLCTSCLEKAASYFAVRSPIAGKSNRASYLHFLQCNFQIIPKTSSSVKEFFCLVLLFSVCFRNLSVIFLSLFHSTGLVKCSGSCYPPFLPSFCISCSKHPVKILVFYFVQIYFGM